MSYGEVDMLMLLALLQPKEELLVTWIMLLTRMMDLIMTMTMMMNMEATVEIAMNMNLRLISIKKMLHHLVSTL